MRRILQFALALFAFAVLLGNRAEAQTGTLVTGTFKNPSALSCAALASRTVTVGGTAMCGDLEFTPYDSAGRRVMRLIYGGITYFPQPVRAWVRASDNVLMSYDPVLLTVSVGIRLIPNINSTPTGTVYRLEGKLYESTDGFIAEGKWSEQKVVPDQASVDWGTIAPAGITALTYLGYNTIQDEGTSRAARTILNFIGSGVDCVDNSGLTRTDCTITSGGALLQIDGVNLISQNPLNFQDSATIDFTNPSAGNVQAAVKSLSITNAMLAGSIDDSKLLSNYSGIGGCTNQFVRTLNDAAAPTCATVTSLDIDSSVASRTGTQTLQNKTLDATNFFSSFFEIAEQATPGNPIAGFLRVYGKTTVKRLCTKDNTGVEVCMNQVTDADVPDTISLNNLTQIATRNYSDLQNIPATFAPAAHALVGADHTAAGLVAGQVVRATAATTFAWQALPIGDTTGTLPDARLSTNVSLLEQTIGTAEIENDAVTYAKLQNVSATSRFLGRLTAGAGDPEELTGTQATTLLDLFTSTLKGLAPASAGGTTNFLRADGTWAAPSGGSGCTVSGSNNQVLTDTGAGGCASEANLTFDGTLLTITGRISIAQGTLTADAQGLSQTVTWNEAATTFTAMKLNVTDTASAAGSLLMDLQVGGVSKFSVTKASVVTATTFTGALSGNASTATALAANPSDCPANQFAISIVASGNLGCAGIVDADVPDSITITLAATATALAANGGNCTGNNFALGVDASGLAECAQPAFSNLSGTIALGQTVLTTRGDLLTANATPALVRLAIGAQGSLLYSHGTDPLWLAAPALYAAAYGVKADTKKVTNASTTSGSGVVTVPAAQFTSADVGKTAWAHFANQASIIVASTITTVNSSTSITLSNVANQTQAGIVTLVWGTDDSAALIAAYAAAKVLGTVGAGTGGGGAKGCCRARLMLPAGLIMWGQQVFRIDGTADNFAQVEIVGQGPEVTVFIPRENFTFPTTVGMLFSSVSSGYTQLRDFGIDVGNVYFSTWPANNTVGHALILQGPAPVWDLRLRGGSNQVTVGNMLLGFSASTSGAKIYNLKIEGDFFGTALYINASNITAYGLEVANAGSVSANNNQMRIVNASDFHWVGGLLDETGDGNCLSLVNSKRIVLEGVRVVTPGPATANAIRVDGTSSIVLIGSTIFGTGAGATADGLEILAGGEARIFASRFEHVSGTGFAINNAGTVYDLGGNVVDAGKYNGTLAIVPFDSANALRFNAAAVAGRYLKGDGANFVMSAGSASGIGGCTNQFVRTLNSDAAPTCASVSLSADVTGTLAKASQHAATVYNDQANTYSGGGLQDFSPNKVALPAATTLPGTCTANKEIFIDTDATPAGQQVYLCNSAGTGWNLIGDGGAGGTNHNLLSATHLDTLTSSPVLGGVLFANSTPAWAQLTGNITTTKQFLSQTGTGTVSAAPAWAQVAFADLSGTATDAQIPDTITITLAATATALAANGGNCSGNNFALGVDASGVAECAQPAFSNLSGTATKSQLPAAAAYEDEANIFTAIQSISLTTAEVLKLGGTQTANDAGRYITFVGGAAGATPRGYLGFTETGTGTPTLFAAADPDSLALRAEGKLYLGTNGDNIAVTIDTSQNVGIGVSPAVKLDVAGQIQAVTSTFAPIMAERTDAGTNTALVAVRVLHSSSADMVDGFAAGLSFAVKDNTSAVETVAAIYGRRSGADNTGRLDFYVTTTGVQNLRMTLDNAGLLGTLDIVNPATGFRIGGGAASGNVLRGDGTNFVSATLAITDLATFTSADLAGRLTNETGTVLAVFNTNPTLDDVIINDVAEFTETAGDATCAAGNFNIKANSTTNKMRGCENGTLFDLNGGGGGAPTGATYLVVSLDGTLTAERNLVAGAGLASSDGGANAAFTLSTASGEAGFLASGALTCGAATAGKVQIHTTPLQYCDNAATPALQYAAYGTSAGEALAGDTATAFFSTGTIEDARLSANVSLLGQTISLTAEVTGILPAANGGTGDDTSAVTGVPRILSGNWTYDAGISHLAASTSADLRGVLSDETGTGAAIFSSPTAFTLDVEAGTNSITTVSYGALMAAACQNATATLLWDTPTTSPAVAACITGTNTQKGVADFADGANLSMQITMPLPRDWTGAVDARFKWLTTATSGNVVWQLATICVADAETDDPAFNTASTVTDTAKGTANQTNDADIAGVTMTGCAAGELLHLKVLRDSAHASDTLAATARLISVELTLRRAQ